MYLFLGFSYGVVFLGSFFLSILAFISATAVFLSYALASNFSLVGLFVSIMYLSSMMVLFSYSFMLSDVKVRFNAHPLNIGGFSVVLIFLCLESGLESLETDLPEVYGHSFSTLVLSGVLLYSVLGACLSLCLGSHVS